MIKGADTTVTTADDRRRKHSTFYHAENDQLESLVKEVARLHQLMVDQDKSWKADVQTRDKIIYEQKQEIEELKKKVEDLEMQQAL